VAVPRVDVPDYPAPNSRADTPVRRGVAVLRRRFWLLLVCAVIGGGVAFFISNSEQKKYSSTSALLFKQSDISSELFGYTTSTYVDPQTEAATNFDLVSQPVVATNTARALHMDVSTVSSDISIAAAGASDVVNVTATTASPSFSARLANEYANQFILYQEASDRAQVVTAANQLQAQITRLSTAPVRSGSLSDLKSRLAQLEVLEAIQTGDVQLAQSATVPTSPSSPRTHRNALLGLIAGLLAGLACMLLVERLDQRLRDIDDVRSLTPLPLLGIIPSSRSLAHVSRKDPLAPSVEGEAFALLRAQIRYFNVDRSIQSILLASPASSEGKSTIAWNLSRMAAALNPDSSVLLVDADHRKPSIATMTQLEAAPGLSEVLTQSASLDEAIRPYPLDVPDGSGSPQLFVLPSGAIPPNPAELMESNRLREVVSELHARFDFIVFDAPPTAIVSDAIPLMTQVSGVLLVVRLRRTHRRALLTLDRQLTNLGAHTLGVVVNDVPASDSSYGGYGGYGTYHQPSIRDSGTLELDPLPSE
jgi:capsular exopolysaccharide synthesis family protein